MGLTAGESFLKTILDVFRVTTANGSRTGTVTLTTATALPSFKCKAVILLSSCDFTTGNGDTISLDNPPLLLPCNNAEEIIVSGGGTLNYLILL